MRYRIRFHPAVADDLDAIARWLIDYAGPRAAARRLDEIEAAIAALGELPHKGGLRHEIAPGLRADFNLIDFDALRLHRPRMIRDLPTGGKRLMQTAEGYRMTWVAGQCVSEDGELTGVRPGRLRRRQD